MVFLVKERHAAHLEVPALQTFLSLGRYKGVHICFSLFGREKESQIYAFSSFFFVILTPFPFLMLHRFNELFTKQKEIHLFCRLVFFFYNLISFSSRLLGLAKYIDIYKKKGPHARIFFRGKQMHIVTGF